MAYFVFLNTNTEVYMNEGTNSILQQLFSTPFQGVMFVIILLAAAIILAASLFLGRRERCPRCKKGFLKEQAFTENVPSFGPYGMGVYRKFYLTCVCGYFRLSRELELVVRSRK